MAQARPRLSSDPGPRFEECQREAHGLLQKAADGWAQGNPEQPTTQEVLGAILRVFERGKSLRRPF
jgi:hypothetical protein